MRLLVDTSIVLEVILEQAKAADARSVLAKTEHEFFISDYSLHSVGVLLFRMDRHHLFGGFLEDMESVIAAARSFHLDFDDAYQYATSAKHDLTLVSFDSDFDRTERGRKTPAEILEG